MNRVGSKKDGLKVVFITDLPVWSMGQGKGAPSFFNTLKAYHDRGVDVVLLTTERVSELASLPELVIQTLPKIPQTQFRGLGGVIRLASKLMAYFVSQVVGLYQLSRLAVDADIVYAYEIGYVPAASVYSRVKGKKFVSRFQGTILTPLLEKSAFIDRAHLMLRFADHVWALKTRSNLTIMTDDGTRGEEVLAGLRGCVSRVMFWKNGVNQTMPDTLPDLDELYRHALGDILFSSVSRLVRWKRLDRSIDIFEGFHRRCPNSHYYICGNGPDMERVRGKVSNLKLQEAVTFLGEVAEPVVRKILSETDYFLSSYELSNLGNPLFEAIVCGAIVITLNNGDTSKLIVDGVTGLISDELNYLDNIQKTIDLHGSPEKVSRIRESARKELARQFMTWEKRMAIECERVLGLVHE